MPQKIQNIASQTPNLVQKVINVVTISVTKLNEAWTVFAIIRRNYYEHFTLFIWWFFFA